MGVGVGVGIPRNWGGRVRGGDDLGDAGGGWCGVGGGGNGSGGVGGRVGI